MCVHCLAEERVNNSCEAAYQGPIAQHLLPQSATKRRALTCPCDEMIMIFVLLLSFVVVYIGNSAYSVL